MPGLRPCTAGPSQGHHDLHATDQVYVRQHDQRTQRQAAAGQLAGGAGAGAGAVHAGAADPRAVHGGTVGLRRAVHAGAVPVTAGGPITVLLGERVQDVLGDDEPAGGGGGESGPALHVRHTQPLYLRPHPQPRPRDVPAAAAAVLGTVPRRQQHGVMTARSGRGAVP